MLSFDFIPFMSRRGTECICGRTQEWVLATFRYVLGRWRAQHDIAVSEVR